MPYAQRIPRAQAFKQTRSDNFSASTATSEGSISRPRSSLSKSGFLRAYIKRTTGNPLTMKQLSRYTKYSKKAIDFNDKVPINPPPERVEQNDISHHTVTDVTPEIVVDPVPRASESNSMSRRRLADNRPALQCVVDLPPVPNFLSRALDSNLTTPSLINILPLPSKSQSDAIPITPVAQIMPHTPENPPSCTQEGTRKPKQRLKLNLDTVKVSRTLEDHLTRLSPSLPFTPLETPTLCANAEGGINPFDLPQRLNALKVESTPSPPTSSGGHSLSSSPAQKASRHPPIVVAIPRRLSYRLSVALPPSPLSAVTPRGRSQTSEDVMLASPLDLQKRYLRKAASGHPDTPMLKPACSPLVTSGSPVGYFSLQA